MCLRAAPHACSVHVCDAMFPAFPWTTSIPPGVHLKRNKKMRMMIEGTHDRLLVSLRRRVYSSQVIMPARPPPGMRPFFHSVWLSNTRLESNNRSPCEKMHHAHLFFFFARGSSQSFPYQVPLLIWAFLLCLHILSFDWMCKVILNVAARQVCAELQKHHNNQ